MGFIPQLFGLGGKKQAVEATTEPEDGGSILVNAYATVGDLPALDFAHRLLSSRDLSDPDMIPHLEGFSGYVLNRGDSQMTAIRYHL